MKNTRLFKKIYAQITEHPETHDQSERNLSQEGDCGVRDDARIVGYARELDDARIVGYARELDDVRVSDEKH